jgi:hypothetical protein
MSRGWKYRHARKGSVQPHPLAKRVGSLARQMAERNERWYMHALSEFDPGLKAHASRIHRLWQQRVVCALPSEILVARLEAAAALLALTPPIHKNRKKKREYLLNVHADRAVASRFYRVTEELGKDKMGTRQLGSKTFTNPDKDGS